MVSRRMWHLLFQDKACCLRLVMTTMGILAEILARAVTRSKILTGVGDVSANREAPEMLIPGNAHLCKPQSDLDCAYDVWEEIRKQFRL